MQSSSRLALVLCLGTALSMPQALAQKKGNNVKIHTGIVVKVEQTTVQSAGKTGAGVLIGGTIGYHATSSGASTKRKRRNPGRRERQVQVRPRRRVRKSGGRPNVGGQARIFAVVPV